MNLKELLAKREKLTEPDRELAELDAQIEQAKAEQLAKEEEEARRKHEAAVEAARERRLATEAEIASHLVAIHDAMEDLDNVEHELEGLIGWLPVNHIPNNFRADMDRLLDRLQREYPQVLGDAPRDPEERTKARLAWAERDMAQAKQEFERFQRMHGKREDVKATWRIKYHTTKHLVDALKAKLKAA